MPSSYIFKLSKRVNLGHLTEQCLSYLDFMCLETLYFLNRNLVLVPMSWI
uniref:Uncharacterized protein n=1 Tax=Rhizophora mucronata TaxID=61149 RepID=A0A2P2PFD1_RHIMU